MGQGRGAASIIKTRRQTRTNRRKQAVAALAAASASSAAAALSVIFRHKCHVDASSLFHAKYMSSA